MNLKFIFRLLLLVLIISNISSYAQEAKFKIGPYANGMTNIKDGFFEIGTIFHKSNMEIKPYLRIPISNKEKAITQIDRNSNTFKGVLSYSYILDITKETGPIKRIFISGQFEFGTKEYKFYPDSTNSSETKSNQISFAGELKIGCYKTNGEEYAKQIAPEFRVRYSKEYKSSDEVGIVMNNSNGISTVKELIITEPAAKPAFSPAISLNFYSGKGDFSYTPAMYYNFIGKAGENNPFNGNSRLRIETWVFYYPVVSAKTGIKIGLSPFVSLRTTGDDSLNKFEYGGMLQLLISTNMLHFF